MSTKASWNISGVDPRTRYVAEEAAHRAGMRLEQWLDEAIEQAVQFGVRKVVGCDEDNWADAVDCRLDRTLRRERTAYNQELYPAAPRPNDDDILGSTIDLIHRRVARSEQRAARAFESILRMLEQSRAMQRGERKSDDEPAQQFPARSAEARDDCAPASDARSDKDRRFDGRMDEIARRAPESPRAPRQPAQTFEAGSGKPHFDLSAAVLHIAKHRHELDAPEALGSLAATREEQADAARKDGPADRGLGEREESPSTPEPLADPRPIETGRSHAPPEPGREDIRTLTDKLEDWRREHAGRCVGAVDLNAMRAEIVAMTRSLAELAPRNAVVALEGAIRDLTGRVAALRENGHGEALLAPLDAMAAELRATVKAHDLQLAASGLEREIRAIGGKIDSLADAAINPETFEQVRRQTEEVSNLLAAAAMRSAPVERLEREIGNLADRVDRMSASPAPQFESARMAASLDDVRKEIERSTPISALLSIERRLEEIAARLDQEIARPERAVIDSHRFSDLTDRIESMRRSLEERTRPDAETRELNASMEKLNAKLEAAEHNGAGARAVEPLLTQMSAKLDAIAAPALQWPAIQDVVEQIARRIENRSASGIDGEVLAEQIAHIHDRLDTIDRQSGKSYNVESVAQELLDRLRKAGLAPSPGEPNAPDEVRAKLAVDLAELRAEQANASRRTHSRLTVLQDILEQLVERIASIEAEVSNDTEHDWRPSAYGETARGLLATALPGIEALGGEDFSDVAPRGRPAESSAGSPEAGPTSADDDEARQASQHGEEILLEPGARAPQLAQTARDRAGSSDSATNSAIRAHIAAARRAAQAAVAEDDGKALNIPRGAPQIRLVTRSVERAKGFYANNKRSVLLGVAVLIVATVAIRLIGAHPPLLQKSDLEKQATKAASVGAPSGEPVDAGRASIPSWSIDPTPTASLGPASETGKAAAPSALESRAQVPPELLTTIPDGLSPALRDAVVAGEPGAQYELAQRLTEGRGVPQDRQAAALWFERAALFGLAPAQFSIAAMYEKGVGVVRDPAAAKRWYLKAAEAGNARAAHNLAVMDAESVNERPDYPEAARWFRKAGELGVRDSQYNLAILYARGLGVEQDLRQSWLWFSLAAGQGDADAAKKRDEVAAKMDPSSLAAAADSLAKFKVARQDPAANEVATPPGGWDARSAPPSARQTPRPPGGETRPQAPL